MSKVKFAVAAGLVASKRWVSATLAQRNPRSIAGVE